MVVQEIVPIFDVRHQGDRVWGDRTLELGWVLQINHIEVRIIGGSYQISAPSEGHRFENDESDQTVVGTDKYCLAVFILDFVSGGGTSDG